MVFTEQITDEKWRNVISEFSKKLECSQIESEGHFQHRNSNKILVVHN